jgi:hypothetical protein
MRECRSAGLLRRQSYLPFHYGNGHAPVLSPVKNSVAHKKTHRVATVGF